MQAYVTAGYSPKAAKQNASEIREITGDRITWLQNQSVAKTLLTLEEKRQFLADVLRTPVGEVDESSPLCQSVKWSEAGKEIKMPCKLKAIAQDNDLAGEGSEAAANASLPEMFKKIALIRQRTKTATV